MRKTILIFIILLTITSLAAGYYTLKNNSDIKTLSKRRAPTPTVSIPDVSKDIIDSQKQLLDHYLELELTYEEERALFFDLMSPLGPFDPFAKELDNVPVKDITNFIYGNYGRKFGLSRPTVTQLPKTTTYFGLEEYDPEVEFMPNKTKFDNARTLLQVNNDVWLIGSWVISVFRVNNYFGDIDRGYVWHVQENEGSFFEYGSIHNVNEDTEYENAFDLVEKHKKLYDATVDLNIHSAYKCGGKTILIMTGTANNALGYIHGAETKDDINCGLLHNRFRIIKFDSIAPNWHYWVGN